MYIIKNWISMTFPSLKFLSVEKAPCEIWSEGQSFQEAWPLGERDRHFVCGPSSCPAHCHFPSRSEQHTQVHNGCCWTSGNAFPMGTKCMVHLISGKWFLTSRVVHACVSSTSEKPWEPPPSKDCFSEAKSKTPSFIIGEYSLCVWVLPLCLIWRRKMK